MLVSELIQSKLTLISSEVALISSEVALISSEVALISADVLHVLWISDEKRQFFKAALFSADYLWDLNPGQQRLKQMHQK